MHNLDFTTSFTDACNEIGMNVHEFNVQDAVCSEGMGTFVPRC